MYCTACGKEIATGTKFCPACGAPQDAETTPQIPHCKKCGNELSPENKFCPVCGTPQDAEAAPQVPKSTSLTRSAPKKKNSLIPILAAVLVVAVAFFAFSSFQQGQEQKKQQERLSTYINVGLADLDDLKDQIIEFLDDAMDTGYEEEAMKCLKDAKKACADLTLKVLDLNTSFNNDNDSELAQVNAQYSAFAKKTSDALDYLTNALNNDMGGTTAKLEFMDLLEEANEKYSQFQESLEKLAGERDVSYSKDRHLPFEDLIEFLENVH